MYTRILYKSVYRLLRDMRSTNRETVYLESYFEKNAVLRALDYRYGYLRDRLESIRTRNPEIVAAAEFSLEQSGIVSPHSNDFHFYDEVPF